MNCEVCNEPADKWECPRCGEAHSVLVNCLCAKHLSEGVTDLERLANEGAE